MAFLLELIAKILDAFQQKPIENAKPSNETVKAPVITLDDWITSSGKYPERAASEELTYDVKSAAMLLVDKINQLSRELDLPKLIVSSGFRPTKVNATIKNAAKSSGHTRGLAVDFVDVDGSLKAKIAANPEVLRKLDLFLEDPEYTKTWAHIDYIKRADRPSRIFKP